MGLKGIILSKGDFNHAIQIHRYQNPALWLEERGVFSQIRGKYIWVDQGVGTSMSKSNRETNALGSRLHESM